MASLGLRLDTNALTLNPLGADYDAKTPTAKLCAQGRGLGLARMAADGGEQAGRNDSFSIIDDDRFSVYEAAVASRSRSSSTSVSSGHVAEPPRGTVGHPRPMPFVHQPQAAQMQGPVPLVSAASGMTQLPQYYPYVGHVQQPTQQYYALQPAGIDLGSYVPTEDTSGQFQQMGQPAIWQQSQYHMHPVQPNSFAPQPRTAYENGGPAPQLPYAASDTFDTLGIYAPGKQYPIGLHPQPYFAGIDFEEQQHLQQQFDNPNSVESFLNYGNLPAASVGTAHRRAYSTSGDSVASSVSSISPDGLSDSASLTSSDELHSNYGHGADATFQLPAGFAPLHAASTLVEDVAALSTVSCLPAPAQTIVEPTVHIEGTTHKPPVSTVRSTRKLSISSALSSASARSGSTSTGSSEGSSFEGSDSERPAKAAKRSAKQASVDGGSDSAEKSKSKNWVCSYPDCGKAFGRNFNLATHYVSSARHFRLLVVTSADQSIMRLQNTHLGIKPFPCSHCTRSFSRRHDCARHVAAVHSGKVADADSSTSAGPSNAGAHANALIPFDTSAFIAKVEE